VYSAELIRDDETICAATEVYFVRIDEPLADHARAAAAIGSEFLVQVCLEALDWRGAVREHIEQIFMDALTDVFVLERINVLDPDADKPVLRGMFVQSIFSTLSRGMDILFVHADPDELPFWRDTIGARQVGDFIAASGARCLPVYPKPPRPMPTRAVVRPRRASASSATTVQLKPAVGDRAVAITCPFRQVIARPRAIMARPPGC
jgi:hypothetical protein